MQRTELSRQLPKFTHGDPVLTLICEYEVSTFDSGTGIVPKLWPSSNDNQLGSHYSGTFLSLPMLLFCNVFFFRWNCPISRPAFKRERAKDLEHNM